MRVGPYLSDKAGWLVCFLLQLVFIWVIGRGFQINSYFVFCTLFLQIVILVLGLFFDYRRKSRFYNDMMRKLEELDKKYLIAEMLEEPNFSEGKLFCAAVYEVGRAMNERVQRLGRESREFQEYVELWIHEIKLPIAALSLMNYNGQMDYRKHRQQIDRIHKQVEQILYYVRADAPQEDFLMKRCGLDQVINEVLQAEKELLIDGKFSVEKEDTEHTVVTDAKWLTFMLSQIVGNSAKYRRGERGYLKFAARERDQDVVLAVEDHGIGVPESDVERVFEKSFTGENGRKGKDSTGMGLYICRKMCRKLGHEIWMESREGEYTRVYIRFGKNDYYVQAGKESWRGTG